jgi:hypothetical protein
MLLTDVAARADNINSFQILLKQRGRLSSFMRNFYGTAANIE